MKRKNNARIMMFKKVKIIKIYRNKNKNKNLKKKIKHQKRSTKSKIEYKET